MEDAGRKLHVNDLDLKKKPPKLSCGKSLAEEQLSMKVSHGGGQKMEPSTKSTHVQVSVKKADFVIWICHLIFYQIALSRLLSHNSERVKDS